MASKGPDALLQEGASLLGVPLQRDQIEAFITYLSVLKRWNKRVNLTSHTTDKAIVEWNFLDSLIGVKGVSAQKGQRLLDMGTGGGFPGIPLKLLRPDLELTLVESVHKKAAFLLHLCGVLGLQGVSVLAERVEAIRDQLEHRGGYDIVSSRAFAKPGMTLKAAAPFLKPGGRVLMYVARSGMRELGQPKGWKVQRVDYTLPLSRTDRVLLVLSHRAL